jgi:hypothetical protein
MTNKKPLIPIGFGKNGRLELDGSEDISSKQKESLGKYLSDVTKANEGSAVVPNDYPIEPNGAKQRDFITSISETVPPSVFYRFGKSEYGETDPKFDEVIDHTDTKNEHDLLSSFKAVDTSDTTQDVSPIQKKVSSVLLNNRFSNGAQSFIEKSNAQRSASITKQDKIGSYDKNAQLVKIDELKRHGLELIVKATGHDTEFMNKALTIPAGLVGNTLAPSALQLAGIKINVNDFVASHDMAGIEDEEEQQKSYGQVYSHLEPFNSAGNSVIAASGLASLVAVANGTLQLVSKFRGVAKLIIGGFHDPMNPAKLEKGSYRDADIISKLLNNIGVPETDHSAEACFLAGVEAFYGVPGGISNIKSAEDILDVAQNIVQAPGFYVGIVRTIVRDIEQVNRNINLKDQVLAGGALVGGVIESALKAINNLTSSASFKFIMTMIKLGDIVLASNDGTKSPIPAGLDLDDLGETRQTISMKSRKESGESMLSWRHRSAPKKYLMPKSIILASENLGDNYRGVRLAGKLKAEGMLAETHEINNGRIKSDVVEALENELELDYMPFYFHDLRTNEIVSLHAFLSNVTDAYAVDYDSVSAYGRVDDVKTYTKTNRTLSLSFIVAATSEQDFDAMWWDVNKLVTMLYPQWSRGNTVETPDGQKFTQPFSQMPTASPLIRLRVGDFIKSNYSKVSLARLFGAGDEQNGGDKFKIGAPMTHINSAADIDKKIEKYSDTYKKHDTHKFEIGANAILRGGAYYFAHDKKDPLSRTKMISPIAQRVKIIESFLGKDEIICVFTRDLTTPISCFRQSLIPDDSNIKNISTTDIAAAAGLPVAKIPLVASAQKPEPESAVTKFFSDGPSGNVIARSFKTTRGRGLAGFITSLDFDYSESTYETTRLGSRAPKLLKINMQFAPVHDIPPGLDHFGINRAPLYNVGSIAHAAGGDPHGNNFGDKGDSVVKKFEELASLGAPGGKSVVQKVIGGAKNKIKDTLKDHGIG